MIQFLHKKLISKNAIMYIHHSMHSNTYYFRHWILTGSCIVISAYSYANFAKLNIYNFNFIFNHTADDSTSYIVFNPIL